MAVLDHLDFDAVIGWAFGVHTKGDSTKDVYAQALVWPWDADEAVALITGVPAIVDVLTVIPNVTRSFRVTAVYDDVPPTRTVIGYLVPGSNHPDWEEEAAARAPP